MRIACPSCDAKYEVPEARLTPQKTVRCSRCGGEWIAMPEVDEPISDTDTDALPYGHAADPGVVAPTITAMDRLAATAPRPRRRTGLIAAWLVTGLLLIGAAAATFTWREAVVRAWPPSSRIFGNVVPVVPALAHPLVKSVH